MDMQDVKNAAEKVVHEGSDVVKKTAHELFEERVVTLALGMALGISAGFALFVVG